MALHEHKPLINLTIAASIVGQGRKLMARTRTEKKKRLLGSPASSFRIQWFINYSGQLILNHYPKLRPFWVGFLYCSTAHPLWVSDLVQPMPPPFSGGLWDALLCHLVTEAQSYQQSHSCKHRNCLAVPCCLDVAHLLFKSYTWWFVGIAPLVHNSGHCPFEAFKASLGIPFGRSENVRPKLH